MINEPTPSLRRKVYGICDFCDLFYAVKRRGVIKFIGR
jgi:hypothetical protein